MTCLDVIFSIFRASYAQSVWSEGISPINKNKVVSPLIEWYARTIKINLVSVIFFISVYIKEFQYPIMVFSLVPVYPLLGGGLCLVFYHTPYKLRCKNILSLSVVHRPNRSYTSICLNRLYPQPPTNTCALIWTNAAKIDYLQFPTLLSCITKMLCWYRYE